MGDYRVSPLYTDETLLKGFPRTLVISAGEDSLAAEDEEFASKLVHAGTEVTAKRFVGSRHGFTINRVDGHDEAFELFLYFLKRAFCDRVIPVASMMKSRCISELRLLLGYASFLYQILCIEKTYSSYRIYQFHKPHRKVLYLI